MWKCLGVNSDKGETRNRQQTNLLVDRVALSENEVTAEQSREKGIMFPLLAAVQFPLDEQERFVHRDKLCEIRRVLPGRVEDGFETCLPAGLTHTYTRHTYHII